MNVDSKRTEMSARREPPGFFPDTSEAHRVRVSIEQDHEDTLHNKAFIEDDSIASRARDLGASPTSDTRKEQMREYLDEVVKLFSPELLSRAGPIERTPRLFYLTSFEELQTWTEDEKDANFEAYAITLENAWTAIGSLSQLKVKYWKLMNDMGQEKEIKQIMEDTIERAQKEIEKHELRIAQVESSLRTADRELKRARATIQELEAVVRVQTRAGPASATPQVGGTPTPSTSSGRDKTTKLPDPELLTDGKNPELEDWLLMVRSKLKANSDHYPTNELQIAYVAGRVGGIAKTFIRARLREDVIKPYRCAEELLDTLEKSLGKSKEQRRAEARHEYRKLKQGNTEFATFWANLQKHALELGKEDDEILEDLRDKLSLELKKTMINDETTELYAFANKCGTHEARLKSLAQDQKIYNEFIAKKASAQASKPSPSGSSFSRKDTSTPTVNTNTGSNQKLLTSSNATQLLRNEGKCFVCQEKGHRAFECPKKSTKTVTVKSIEEVTDDALEEESKTSKN